jgi:hypothetical protein
VIFRQETAQFFESENDPAANSAAANFFSRQHGVERPNAYPEHLRRFDPIYRQTFHPQPPGTFLLQDIAFRCTV